jgi:hypothetical protein
VQDLVFDWQKHWDLNLKTGNLNDLSDLTNTHISPTEIGLYRAKIGI